jgi:hypothetical protein
MERWPNASDRSATTRSAIRWKDKLPNRCALSCEIARRLKRNGVLRSDWSRGLVVGAVDGIEICSSLVRCCDACMAREVQHKVNGEMKTDIQYYHRIVVVVLVSTSFPIPLGVRFQKNGEGEVACALALLQDLVGQLGRRFLDVLLGDALYLQAPFVKQGGAYGASLAFTLKENQSDLLREAERCTQASPTGVHQEPSREIPILAFAGSRLARRRSPSAGHQNRSPGTAVPRHGQGKRGSS